MNKRLLRVSYSLMIGFVCILFQILVKKKDEHNGAPAQGLSSRLAMSSDVHLQPIGVSNMCNTHTNNNCHARGLVANWQGRWNQDQKVWGSIPTTGHV